MILLDTDHLSVFTDERDARHALLNQRMEAAMEPVVCTIVSVEGQVIVHALAAADFRVELRRKGGVL